MFFGVDVRNLSNHGAKVADAVIFMFLAAVTGFASNAVKAIVYLCLCWITSA